MSMVALKRLGTVFKYAYNFSFSSKYMSIIFVLAVILDFNGKLGRKDLMNSTK
jgi:hypothetical protein